ncbi:hypothetical protein JCM14635_07530 [Megalodesulfovibrio paquesii]
MVAAGIASTGNTGCTQKHAAHSVALAIRWSHTLVASFAMAVLLAVRCFSPGCFAKVLCIAQLRKIGDNKGPETPYS